MKRRKNLDLIPFKYAKISKGQRIQVVYYVRDPAAGQLKRMRVCSMPYDSRAANIRHAQIIAREIDRKLDEGWNPFIEGDNSKTYTEVKDALHRVLKIKRAFVVPRTLATYENRMQVFLKWMEQQGHGKKYIFEVSEEIASAFFEHLVVDRGVTARTHNNYLLDFRTFFNTLEKQKYISSNPFRAVSKLRESQKKRLPMTDKEFSQFKESLQEYELGYRIACRLTYHCAIRNTELSKMKVQDIDVQGKIITLDGSTTKAKRVRSLPIIDEQLVRDLRRYTAAAPPEYFLFTEGYVPGPGRYARLPENLTDRFRIIAEKHAFRPGVTYYSLKDTLAKHLIAARVDLKVIQQLLGHSSPAMSANYIDTYSPRIRDQIAGKYPNL